MIFELKTGDVHNFRTKWLFRCHKIKRFSVLEHLAQTNRFFSVGKLKHFAVSLKYTKLRSIRLGLTFLDGVKMLVVLSVKAPQISITSFIFLVVYVGMEIFNFGGYMSEVWSTPWKLWSCYWWYDSKNIFWQKVIKSIVYIFRNIQIVWLYSISFVSHNLGWLISCLQKC